MISRLTSEVFIPSVPVVIPSLIAIVLTSSGVPPAARTPSVTLAASCLWFQLHGMVPIQAMGYADLRPRLKVFVLVKFHRLRSWLAPQHDQGLRAVCGCYVADPQALVLSPDWKFIGERRISSTALYGTFDGINRTSTFIPGTLSRCPRNPAPAGVRKSHVQNGTAFGETLRVSTSSPIRNLAQSRSCGNDG